MSLSLPVPMYLWLYGFIRRRPSQWDTCTTWGGTVHQAAPQRHPSATSASNIRGNRSLHSPMLQINAGGKNAEYGP